MIKKIKKIINFLMVLIKYPKKKQDMSIDLPTVGSRNS